MRAFAARRGRRARLDHGDRGRRRRRQRHRHGASSTPTASASPSCTSCAAGSAGAATRASACSSRTARRCTPARERLDAVAATTDGFELSRVDLAQRREGDVLGRSQSGGRSGLQTLKVLRDEDTIVAARGLRGGPARGRPRPAREPPCWRWRWQRWSNHGSLSSWRSHDRPRPARRPRDLSRAPPMTRIIGGTAGGRRLLDPPRRAHPAHQRPGPRGAVLGRRVLVRLAARPALPRPVRRLRRRRARGLVARGRRGDAGRAGPPHGRADRRQRPHDRLPPRQRGDGPGDQHAAPAPGGAVRRGLPRPAVPAARRGRARRPARARRARLAGAGRDGGRRAVGTQPRAGLAGRDRRPTPEEVRRDRALVRSRVRTGDQPGPATPTPAQE